MGWKLVWFRLAAFFAVMGPGFITANVDNDPGGILTYSQAGAKFGYSLLWTLIPTTIALIVVQEMAARMGAVTGKGLSDLIREEFGLRITFFTMLVLGLADLGNIAAEFAGIASGMGIFGISKYLTVPVGAAVVWFVIVRGSYKPVERIFILLSLIYFTYPVSAFLAHPDWPEALRRTVIPEWDSESGLHRDDRGPDRHHRHAVDAVLPAGVDRGKGHHGEALLALAVGRHHRLHRDRRDRVLHRGGVRRDACSSAGHRNISDAAEAALALKPFAGRFATLLFAIGLVNASMLSAAILPLATAYNVCEGLGFESGVDRQFGEAPIFYGLYTFLIVVGSGCVLIPGLPLMKLILLSQVANGVLIPFVLVFMLILVNKRGLMGDWKNGLWANAIAGTTSVVMIGLTAMMVWNSLHGG